MVSEYSQYAWLIPLLPLIAFLVLIALGRQLKELGTWISIIAAAASFVLAIVVFAERVNGNVQDYLWDSWQWINVGQFTLNMGFEVTNLNALMLVIVTLVGLLVNIYSKGYMKGDGRINVFYSYISLFTFSMLGLVISTNLVQLFIFWELVGVCSFLLVGFWFFKPEARAAAKKAFIVTRVGDVGLFIGIILLFWYMPGHQLDFVSIQQTFANNPPIEAGMITLIAILIFVGAMGKSGQFPLHTWLPDAMEGPTPISALIHAATMVAAGVYLVARTFDIFQASSDAMLVVAIVGGFTAIFAATIGVAQNDIKRVLAFSTISQLGYMMMALGLGAMAAGMFHLFTHAFFKALLFLGAGSVIHAIHTQNIQEMGGVSRRMKLTTWTFGIGALALSGIPPFSGFWSKDAILAEAYHQNQLLFWVGLIAAFFTALYMSRLFFLVFTGKSRSKQIEQAKESPISMTLPLVVLAVLAIGAGFVFMPGVPWFGEWLTGTAIVEEANAVVMILSAAVGLLGIGVGWYFFGRAGSRKTAEEDAEPSFVMQLLSNKYYIDELYQYVIVTPLRVLGKLLVKLDYYLIDGLVRLVALTALTTGKWGTRMQNGQVQTYGMITVIGFIILLLAIVGRRFIHVG